MSQLTLRMPRCPPEEAEEVARWVLASPEVFQTQMWDSKWNNSEWIDTIYF